MTDPPAAKERRCCTSYVNYPHQPTCTSKGGRTPTAAGTAPNRNIRIHDADWDPCVAQANADGQPISVFVREAITRELTRRRSGLTSTPATDVLHVHAPSGGVAVFHGDGTAEALGNVDTMSATARELDRREAEQ